MAFSLTGLDSVGLPPQITNNWSTRLETSRAMILPRTKKLSVLSDLINDYADIRVLSE